MSTTTLKAIAVALSMYIAYGYYTCSAEKKEPFLAGLPPMTYKVDRTVMSNDQKQRKFFSIPGYYQSQLAPIGGAGMVDYGAYIRYKKPSNDMLRTPDYKTSTPISYASRDISTGMDNKPIISDNNTYTGSLSNARSGSAVSKAMNKKNGMMKEGFISNGIVQQQQQGGNGMMQNVDALGQTIEQPIIVDRIMFANQKSRLVQGADWIRGDLPIMPDERGWFSPSVHPQIDLRAGAMAVLGGESNRTNQQLLALQSASTAGLLNTGSGINFSVQKSMSASANGGDVRVTAFP